MILEDQNYFKQNHQLKNMKFLKIIGKNIRKSYKNVQFTINGRNMVKIQDLINFLKNVLINNLISISKRWKMKILLNLCWIREIFKQKNTHLIKKQIDFYWKIWKSNSCLKIILYLIKFFNLICKISRLIL